MPLKWYSSMKKFYRKIRIIFDIENWLWKSAFCNFWQLLLNWPTARLKNFLRGWLLVLSLKKGLVECAKVSIKSEVILQFKYEFKKILISLPKNNTLGIYFSTHWGQNPSEDAFESCDCRNSRKMYLIFLWLYWKLKVRKISREIEVA